jgi:hypothetical protein
VPVPKHLKKDSTNMYIEKIIKKKVNKKEKYNVQ